MALWLGLYLVGVAVVISSMLLRGADSVLVSSWGARLAWYGLIATLPQAGWAVGLALVCRRAWHLVTIAIGGAMVAAILSSTLLTQQVQFPTPLWLRARLLSGHAGTSLSSAFGLVAWGILFAGAGLGVRIGTRARRRATGLLSSELDL